MRLEPVALAPADGEIEVHRELDSLWPEWDDLATGSGAMPFARPGWFAAWRRAFGGGELELIALRRGRRLRAVLPLERRDGVLVAPTNAHTPFYELVAADSRAAAAVIAAALRRGSRRLELGELDRAGPTAAAVHEVAKSRSHPLRVAVVRRSPFVLTDASVDVLESRLPRERRRKLRRSRRRLGELGRVSVSFEDGGERLPELLAEGFAVEGSQWKLDAGTAITSSPATVRFYSEVAHWAAAQGLLELRFLRVDGRPLAFAFGLRSVETVYSLKAGFDPRFRSLAPGITLLAETLEAAHGDATTRIELLGDADPLKLEFAHGARTVVRAQAFADGGRGRAAWLAQSYARPLTRRIAAAASRGGDR